VTATKNVRVRY